MRKYSLLSAGLALLLLFSIQSASAAPRINGLAVHQELGNDLFIGAVFTEELTDDASTLISSQGEKRMELKILSEGGIPPRRFSRLWIEGMAINNPNTVLTEQADNMVEFSNLFRGRLRQNDHVVFHLVPGEGVNIETNGNLLGTIEDTTFFALLLRTWVGAVPLSSGYRDSILSAGSVNADLRFRYDRIQPAEDRIEAVAQWHAPEPEPEPEPEPSPAPTPTPQPAAAPTVSTPPPVALTRPEREPEPEPEPESEPEPAVAQEEDDDDDLEVLTAESLLAQQFYHSDLLRAINGEISYPRRALQRGLEGGVRIGVVLNRDGTIADMSWLEESNHALLNREAWRAIEDAAPFAAIPDAIRDDRYEFTVPVNFRLP